MVTFGSGVFLLLIASNASATSLRQRGHSASLTTESVNHKDKMPTGAIKRVIDMLDNLIAEMDAEQAKDEQQFAEFTTWCGKQQEATSQSIEMLQNKIEELGANLAQLYSQKMELESTIARLDGEIATTREQIATATQKRQ